ncbi:MAG: PH domain-containing protein [Gammaproteobacteria bacterium]
MNARSRPDTSRRYSLAPAGRWGLVLWLWLPLLAAAGAVAYAAPHDRTWLHAGMLLAIAIAGSLAFLRRGIDLQGLELKVRSTLFTKRVAVPSMRLDAARIVDLAERTDLKPGLKKMGFGYPGFYSDRYRTHGGQNAFCLITDSRRVLAIPLHDGGWLLTSPERPRQLLQDLQQLAGTRRTP